MICELILPKEQLESRQSPKTKRPHYHAILPKEQLESRQSSPHYESKDTVILPKEQLESRQSRRAWRRPRRRFCRKNNWNQGKAYARKRLSVFYFAERTIGIKAKPLQ